MTGERALFPLTVLLFAACDKPATRPTAVPWVLDTAPRITISTSGVPPGQELTGVQSARRLSDGRIVLANSGTSALLLFDSAGGFVRAIGRKGEGPGEFSGSMHIFRAPGDSLAVYDGGNLRWTLYDGALNLGRTVLAAEAGIPRPTWLHNGTMVTNAALDDSTNWAAGVIDDLRALDPDFTALIEARLDDTGALWVREANGWTVHRAGHHAAGRVILTPGVSLLQAGAGFVVGIAKDSVDQEVVQLFRLERAAATAAAGPPALGKVPDADTALVAAISNQLLMKQEMYYADRTTYASHIDSLPDIFDDGVKAFVLWGDARHWAAVTVRKSTGATCGVSVGWPAPAGWFDGTAFCGQE